MILKSRRLCLLAIALAMASIIAPITAHATSRDSADENTRSVPPDIQNVFNSLLKPFAPNGVAVRPLGFQGSAKYRHGFESDIVTFSGTDYSVEGHNIDSVLVSLVDKLAAHLGNTIERVNVVAPHALKSTPRKRVYVHPGISKGLSAHVQAWLTVPGRNGHESWVMDVTLGATNRHGKEINPHLLNTRHRSSRSRISLRPQSVKFMVAHHHAER